MKNKHKIWSQQIPLTIEEAWSFFSRPENLNSITPPDFRIRLIEDISHRELEEGMEIRYHLSPMRGLPLQWTTRITEVDKYTYFIYEQKKGPYKTWIHEHYFYETVEGVIITDKLTYALKWGFLGEWLDKLIVENRIEKIFDYRAKEIKRRFGGARV